jgi:hypothetical protein
VGGPSSILAQGLSPYINPQSGSKSIQKPTLKLPSSGSKEGASVVIASSSSSSMKSKE